MTPELRYLVWGIVLLLVHVATQATLSDLSKGLGWSVGPRDKDREQSKLAARVDRALGNFLQTFVCFASLAIVLKVTDLGSQVTATGAAIWFWARVVYVPAYASGIPALRSVAWFASIFGLVMMLFPLLSL